MIDAAELNIGYTQQRHRHNPVPWWNDECETTTRASKKALYRYKKTQIPTEPHSTETSKSQGEDNHKKEEATSMGRLHLDTNNEHPNVGDMENNPQDTRQKKILQNNSSQPVQRHTNDRRDTNGKHPRRTISKSIQ
ncbi:hypothetical protein MTP99_009189 [Tenebrio molitor]|nr:hypothetical protein MTP99_009189 [Tenebrio molitor]